MRTVGLVAIGVLASGCTLIEEEIYEMVPAAEVSVVDVQIQRGSFRYVGASTPDIQINGSARGRPSEEPGQRSETDWSVSQHGETLYLRGDSFGVAAGVFYDVEGPSHVHTDVDLRYGDVELYDITGNVDATGGYVYAEGLTGTVRLDSRWHGVDAYLLTRPGNRVTVRANGDVCLAVPGDQAYTISVLGDGDYGVFVDVGPWGLGGWSSYYAWGGRDAIEIDVIATGGEVWIYPAEWGNRCWW